MPAQETARQKRQADQDAANRDARLLTMLRQMGRPVQVAASDTSITLDLDHNKKFTQVRSSAG